MKLKLTLAIAVGVVAIGLGIVAQGCGSSCGPNNCSGCCDTNNQCQLGSASSACGKGGAACAACGAGQQCTLNTCAFPGGGGNSGNTTSGTTSSGTTTSGSSGTTSSSGSSGTTTSSTTTSTTGNTTSSTTTSGTTTSGTTTSSTTSGTTTSSTTSSTSTSGTTGSQYCAAAPTQTTLNNGGIGDPCSPQFYGDGGLDPVQSNCSSTSQVCIQYAWETSTGRCTQACTTTTPGQLGSCPGNAYCDIPSGQTQGACLPIVYDDDTGCPSGEHVLVKVSPQANDIGICYPACNTAVCQGVSSGMTCSNNYCHCTSDNDCLNLYGASQYKCDTTSGVCYLPCTGNTSCTAVSAQAGCCLQSTPYDYCDPYAQ